jgi:hypothetical protein
VQLWILIDDRDARGAPSAGLSTRNALPTTTISPLSGGCAPDRIFISVDLPAPFLPTSACTSPQATSKSTSSSARVPKKLLVTPRARSASEPPTASIRVSS